VRRKGAAEAPYALDNLLNKVFAAENQTVLPDDGLIAAELGRSRKELERRRLHPAMNAEVIEDKQVL
jgi:hypothetical protein